MQAGAEAQERDTATFDQVAPNYEQVLNQALSATGESSAYFSQARIAYLSGLPVMTAHPVREILDFGCGTGGGLDALTTHFPEAAIHGVDLSSASIAIANQRARPHPPIGFSLPDELPVEAQFSLAVTNGVFHHIPPEGRAEALEYVRAHLKTDGYFAFFENNAWNPATRWIMSRCPFDQDAQVISPRAAAIMLRAQGFEPILTRSLFYFPSSLKFLRGLEPALAHLPFGGQYLILARKAKG